MGQTEGFSLYWNDCCVMQQTVHDGACNHRITKHLIPLGKIDVGCDDCAITLIPSVNQLEETIHELMAAENKARYLDNLTAVDMLVLDDFGAEWQSDFMIAKAFEIMNKRYITRKPLIVTTNFTKEQILHPKPQLNRVMSRLWEMCLPINADGADKRRVKVYSRQDEFPEMYPPTQPSNPT